MSYELETINDLMIVFGPDAMRQFTEEIGKFTDYSYRLTVAYQTFGRRGAEVLAILDSCSSAAKRRCLSAL